MTMHHNSTAIRDCLPDELLHRLPETWCDPQLKLTGGWEDYVPHYNGKTGELLFRVPAANPVRVSRRKLKTLMAEGVNVKCGLFQYSKSLSTITLLPNGTGVRATFSDHSTATGSILVGCEGVRSPTRGFLLGTEGASPTRVTNMPFYNFTQTYTREQALKIADLHPQYINSTHEDGLGLFWISSMVHPVTGQGPFCGHYLTMMQYKRSQTRSKQRPGSSSSSSPGSEKEMLEKKPFCPFVYCHHISRTNDPCPQDATSTNATRLAEFKRRAAHWAEPWRTAGINVKDDTPIPRDVLAYWEPQPWENNGGRVTIAGDAAHPMMPCMSAE
ncbi:MAG: hypothetical protein Q9227_007364 [Pyrenula ochraceoflavens]